MTDTAFTEKSAQLRDGRTAAILRPAEITPRARVGGARTIPMVPARSAPKSSSTASPRSRLGPPSPSTSTTAMNPF